MFERDYGATHCNLVNYSLRQKCERVSDCFHTTSGLPEQVRDGLVRGCLQQRRYSPNTPLSSLSAIPVPDKTKSHLHRKLKSGRSQNRSVGRCPVKADTIRQAGLAGNSIKVTRWANYRHNNGLSHRSFLEIWNRTNRKLRLTPYSKTFIHSSSKLTS